MKIQVKRAYAEKSADDGYRVLVDRIWPRGISKEKAGIDLWLKDVAPSTALRKWFAHDPAKWREFQKRYHAELTAAPDAVAQLKDVIRQHKLVTLVYGAKDEEHNQAVALKAFLAP